MSDERTVGKSQTGEVPDLPNLGGRPADRWVDVTVVGNCWELGTGRTPRQLINVVEVVYYFTLFKTNDNTLLSCHFKKSLTKSLDNVRKHFVSLFRH